MPDEDVEDLTHPTERSSDEDHDVTEYFVDSQGKLQGDRLKADKVLSRIKKLEENQSSMRDQLERNTSITQKVSHDTNQILELLEGVKTVVRVIVTASKFSKWLFGTIITIYGLYLLWRGKIPEDLINPLK